MALHLIVTDSGVGGLSACAAIERALRESSRGGAARITYVNVWPSETGGYNDMTDIQAEAEVFDRALSAMAALQPDRIVIACNTLSIVYEHTRYLRAVDEERVRESESPKVRKSDTRTSGRADIRTGVIPPVLGIVDAGVDLFFEALIADPGSRIALFGTKTTIESGVHRERLVAKGVSPDRIIPVGCHGLARSIETEMDGPSTTGLIEECTARAAQAYVTDVGRRLSSGSRGEAATLFLAVCCTHYTYLRDEMKAALQARARVDVQVLDPTDRLVSQVGIGDVAEAPAAADVADVASPTVSVVSKVKMPDEKRRVIAARLAGVSPATAQALLSYAHVPDLF